MSCVKSLPQARSSRETGQNRGKTAGGALSCRTRPRAAGRGQCAASPPEVERLIVLGIDPGYAIVGYGVIRAERGRYVPVEYGAVTTQAGEDFGRRLEQIYAGVGALLARAKPQALSLEKLYFQNNKTTAIGVAEARGVILLAASQAGVPVFEYTPLQVKQAVTGYGQAKKPQVMEAARRLLCLREMPKPDDTADALAMAICHGQAAGSALRRAMLARPGSKIPGRNPL